MATKTDVHLHEDVHISMTEVNALFESKAAAEEAARTLEARRLHVEDAQVWEAGDHPMWAYDSRLGDDMRWAGTNGLIAAMVGATVMGTTTVVLSADSIGVGMALLLGALTGLGFGGMLGAMFGLQRSEPLDDDPLIVITPETGSYGLTFVTARPTRARRAVLEAGGRLVSEPGHNLPVTS